jgi:hypothetical protein
MLKSIFGPCESICGVRVGVVVLVALFFFQRSSAQSVAVFGSIKEAGGRPVGNANVLLFKSPDSSLVKAVMSDTAGRFFFDNIGGGDYYTVASFAGMETVYSKLFRVSRDTDQVDLGEQVLRNTSVQLQKFIVNGKKPLFEQKIDRMVINVKSSITGAGGTALDVLEKSPGVTVNRQNNSIGINGKNGVAVMINGKISYMPADALLDFLAGIPAGNIEKIELITTPPAKFDAGGNAGYINIVLINNPYEGLSGSYFLSPGYGENTLAAAGGNFNFRSGRANLYGNYSFNYDHHLQPYSESVQLPRGGELITSNSFADRVALTQVHNARLGFDYQLDTSSIIGVLVSGYDSRWTMVAHSGSAVGKNNVPDTTILTLNNPELNHWQNIVTNFNFQHTFQPGKVLFLDVNYIYYKDNNPNNYSTDYYRGTSDFLYHEDSRGRKITPIHFKVFSGDYTTPLGKNGKMEAGAKVSLSNFNNDVSVDYLKGAMWIPDSSLSSNYLLRENIGAAYASFSLNPNSGLSMTAGLRYEYTNSNLGTTKIANIIDKKYGELFPTFTVSQKLDGANSLNFTYSRRITRPAFNDLAPFTIFFDPKTFYSGNPALQPAIANNLQASYSYAKYSLAISFTSETNTIDNWYFQTKRVDTVSGIVYLSTRNLKYERYLTGNLLIPVVVTKWWSMQNNVTVGWRRLSTVFDNVAVLYEDVEYSLSSTQRFILPANFSAEISGAYSSSSFAGTAKRKPFYQLDAGVQWKFGKNSDLLRFAATDVFNSANDLRFGETVPGFNAVISRTFNFRTAAYRLTYTHNFGNKALKGKRERATGAEDELKRVN